VKTPLDKNSVMSKSDWQVFSSYDLHDVSDGASLHLAELFNNLAQHVNFEFLGKKNSDQKARLSLAGRALNRSSFVFSVASFFRLMPSKSIRQPTKKTLLLGSHSLLLAPVFSKVIYVPLDCWSARESALSARTTGKTKKFIRIAYSTLVKWFERRLLPKVSQILVVSEAEKQKYLSEYPYTRGKIFIVPPRKVFKMGKAQMRSATSDTFKILIWVDARVGHGREAAVSCLQYLDGALQTPRARQIEVTLLSRLDQPPQIDGLKLQFKNQSFAPDLDQVLNDIDLVILPDLFGSGIKNRVLEVASRGISMLCTSTALEGFDWSPIEDFVPVYESFGDFKRELYLIMNNQNTRQVQNLLDRLSFEDRTNIEQYMRIASLFQ
jgi:hypothetical protein